MPYGKKVVRRVVQPQLRGEFAALHGSIRLGVTQTQPRFDLVECQRNSGKLLDAHGVLADLRDGVQASIANSLTLRGDGSQELNARPDQQGPQREEEDGRQA